MASEPLSNPLTSISGAMAGILELSGAAKVVEACERLTAALTEAAEPPPRPVPEGVRPDIHQLVALLSLPTWSDVVSWATRLGVDLRDLTSEEFAYLEHVSEKTAANWRSEGTGPLYRNQGRILYPVSEVFEWRRKGKQRMVSQGARRGRRAR